jgi:NAD(P)-dependent dehydrogenase (short-subunit alcohol dehydrogenase family)
LTVDRLRPYDLANPGRRRPEPLAAVAASKGALDVVCDVSDAGQVAGAVALVVERFGRLDGLVLNAGVMVPGGISDGRLRRNRAGSGSGRPTRW